MNTHTSTYDLRTALTRLNRVILHLRCLCRDHKFRWHLAGILRELTLH